MAGPAWLAGAAWLAASAALFGAEAQTLAPDPLREQNVLFRRLLRAPSDPDANFRYAASTRQTGDIEAAIGALERLLYYNPTLASAQFELGTLYYRLGSYEMARGYFQAAAASPSASPELRARAESFLARIEQRLRPSQWTGFAQTGLRYQSNASVGPDETIASLFGIDRRFAHRPDWNWFGTVGLDYVYDFGNQRGDVFEASVLAYDAQQFRLSEFDLATVDVAAGPRFALFPDLPGRLSIKPYVIAGAAALADRPYSGGLGGGVTLRFDLGAFATVEPLVEVRQRDYQSSSVYPLAEGLSGTLGAYAVRAGGALLPNLRWVTRIGFDHDEARYAAYGYNRLSFDLWLPWDFASPLGDGRRWVLAPSFGIRESRYRAPDPNINAALRRHDFEWRAGASLDVPVTERFGLGLQVQYRAADSNLSLYDSKDLSVTVGPTLRF